MAVQPLVVLARVIFAVVVAPRLTGWLPRLIERFIASELQHDVNAGSAGATLSGRYNNAVFIEGVGWCFDAVKGYRTERIVFIQNPLAPPPLPILQRRARLSPLTPPL